MPQVRGVGGCRAERRRERERERQRERERERGAESSDGARAHALLDLPPPSLSLSLTIHPSIPSPPHSHPQGGIDHLENPLTAAARELREETGIVSARTVAIGAAWVPYSHPTVVPADEAAAPRVRLLRQQQRCAVPAPASTLARSGVAAAPAPAPSPSPSTPSTTGTGTPSKNNVLPFTHVRYPGQTQKWVLMRFTGDEAEIDLDPAALSAWTWLPLADVVAATVPFKRAVYEGVAREFGPLIEVWADRPDAQWWGR